MRGAALAIAVLLFATPALAEDEGKAEQLFNEGEAAFKAGDYRGAAAAFESAYHAKEHPAVLWNAAQAWQRAGEDRLAANELLRYLSTAPADAPHRDEANRALTTLLRQFGRVKVQALDGTVIRVDGADFDANAPFVAPGEHVASTDRTRKIFVARAGETVSVILEAHVEAPPAPPRPSSSPIHSPWIAAAGGVLVVAGALVGTWSGIDTVDKAHTFDRTPTRANLDAGDSAQTRTNVVIGITAVVAVATAAVAVFLVHWGGERK